MGLAGPAGAAPSGSTGSSTKAPDLGVLNEQYNLTRLRLEKATAALQATDARLNATRAEADQVQDAVRARSARLYRGAGGDGVASILSAGSVDELARRTEYYGAAAKLDRRLLSDLSKTLQQLSAERAAQRDAEAKLRAEADAVSAARRKLMAEAAAAAAKRPRPAERGGTRRHAEDHAGDQLGVRHERARRARRDARDEPTDARRRAAEQRRSPRRLRSSHRATRTRPPHPVAGRKSSRTPGPSSASPTSSRPRVRTRSTAPG